ncbi:hypothetical protein DFH27DRAFT_525412 [Peziza echinospora]|nr:hypothetical protein DFH27DRAFT_525412 [Peziza echinospora]
MQIFLSAAAHVCGLSGRELVLYERRHTHGYLELFNRQGDFFSKEAGLETAGGGQVGRRGFCKSSREEGKRSKHSRSLPVAGEKKRLWCVASTAQVYEEDVSGNSAGAAAAAAGKGKRFEGHHLEIWCTWDFAEAAASGLRPRRPRHEPAAVLLDVPTTASPRAPRARGTRHTPPPPRSQPARRGQQGMPAAAASYRAHMRAFDLHMPVADFINGMDGPAISMPSGWGRLPLPLISVAASTVESLPASQVGCCSPMPGGLVGIGGTLHHPLCCNLSPHEGAAALQNTLAENGRRGRRNPSVGFAGRDGPRGRELRRPRDNLHGPSELPIQLIQSPCPDSPRVFVASLPLLNVLWIVQTCACLS